MVLSSTLIAARVAATSGAMRRVPLPLCCTVNLSAVRTFKSSFLVSGGYSPLVELRREMSTQVPGGGGASARLAAVCTQELNLEEQRDAIDGTSAIPPMIPSGWTMEHRPSTNYFLLRRNRQRAHAGGDARASSPSAPRVFRSRQEEAIAALHGSHRSGNGGSSRNRSATSASSQASADDGVDVIVHCPMRTQDPSLHDAAVDLCEWTPFDVLVRKPADATANMLFLSLASVNSELRVRSVQVLSPWDAAAVLPHAVGGGLSALDVVGKFGVEGEYYREVQLYRGPLITDLSKPMREELLSYIHGSLGITNVVREYICQMLFVVEQEAYVAWLAQMAYFGAKEKKRGGDSGGGEGAGHTVSS